MLLEQNNKGSLCYLGGTGTAIPSTAEEAQDKCFLSVRALTVTCEPVDTSYTWP